MKRITERSALVVEPKDSSRVSNLLKMFYGDSFEELEPGLYVSNDDIDAMMAARELKNSGIDVQDYGRFDYSKNTFYGEESMRYREEKDPKVGEILKDLKGNFSGSNDDQFKAVQLMKGLAGSDDPDANQFMKALDKATTAIINSMNEKKESKPISERMGTSYEIRVSLRDTKEAVDIISDMGIPFSRPYPDVFEFEDEEVARDVLSFFNDNGIEILNTSFREESLYSDKEKLSEKEEDDFVVLEKNVVVPGTNRLLEAGDKVRVLKKENREELMSSVSALQNLLRVKGIESSVLETGRTFVELRIMNTNRLSRVFDSILTEFYREGYEANVTWDQDNDEEIIYVTI